jgi:hypothetical protein
MLRVVLDQMADGGASAPAFYLKPSHVELVLSAATAGRTNRRTL